MKSVIRQQWKARYKTALMLCAIISLIGFSIIISGQGTKLFSKNSSLLQYWLSIAFLGVYLGVPLYALVSIITTINDMVFKDTKYLMLTLPKRSWKLIGGRFLVILGEFILYAAVMLFWLSILFAAKPFYGFWVDGQRYGSQTVGFFNRLTELYTSIFVKNVTITVQVIPLTLIFAVYVMMVFSFSLTLFASIFRHKQFPKVLSIILVYFIFDLCARLITAVFRNYNFSTIASFWPLAGALFLISMLLFVGTCVLFEKRIEV